MSWGGCGEAKDSRGTPHRSPPVIRASRTAKRRPDGIRCGATLISSQPPPCPTTRAHGCIWSTPRSTARRVWRGRRALPTSPRESRSCPARGCPPRRKPMTGWCTWSRTPAMIPPRSSRSGLCRSKRDESGHGHQCRPRLGQPRFAVVDLRPPLNTKSEHQKVVRIPCISADRIAL
jgi:hypothetical protein